MDQSGESPLTQQSAVSEADSLYSSQNRGFSAPGTAGENSSMAVGDNSPGRVTSEPSNLHSVNPAGQTTGRHSLQYQGTDYTILSIPEQTFYLTQGDPLMELVSFPEALQLALSHRFGDFASMMFDRSTSGSFSLDLPRLIVLTFRSKLHRWCSRHLDGLVPR